MKKKILNIFFFLLVTYSYAQEKEDLQLINKLKKRSYPKWFKDAKLGIFIHWGLYSVPSYGGKESYGEWFLRGLQSNDTLRTNFMKKVFGRSSYKDLTQFFKAELFNPNQWVDLFKKSGAKYVVLVSKHHDGYALWNSKYNRNWNSVDNGPKRDIVGDLTQAVRKAGLKMGLYYSLAEWNHPLHRWYTDPHNQIGNYVDTYMIPQFKELISTYKPSLVFADGEWYNTAKQWHSAELIDWYYNLVGSDAIVNNRWGHGLNHGFLTPEYSAGIRITDRPWAEVRGIGRSFGLNRNENLEAYDTSAELIHRFVQTVANGGGMILNVGPKADGQIPLIQQERLLQLGKWLKINSKAIYGAQPYTIKELEKPVVQKRIDTHIDFNWVRNAPMKNIKEDNFSAHWKGYITAPKTDTYTFEINADDQAALWINGKAILNQNYKSKSSESQVMQSNTGLSAKGKINLKKGKMYSFELKYKEQKQNAHIHLYWKTKKSSKSIIPKEVFYQDIKGNTNGLNATYSSLKTYLCFTKNHKNIYAISFNWPEKELILELPNLKKTPKVRLLGLDRDLPVRLTQSKLYVDTSGILFKEMPSYDTWTFEIITKD